MRQPKREVVDDKVIERMLEIMQERRISQQELVDHLGLANGIFTNWKYKGSKSYMNYIDKISECLGVSKTYLVSGEDEQINRDSITRFEVEIITMLRELDDRKRELSYQTIKAFWDDTKMIQKMNHVS